MNEQVNQDGFRMSIGGPSILLLLIVFVLSIFAVLSVRASFQEVRLTKQSREAVLAYYNADSKAEEVLSQIDERLTSLSKSKKIKESDLNAAFSDFSVSITVLSEDRISYEIPITEKAALVVELKVIKPTGMDDTKRFDILSWKMKVEEQTGYLEDEFEIWEPVWIE